MMLSVRDVSAGYGTAPVLRNVSFSQNEGEILGIVGHNGMGKTTMLRVLMGLIGADRGSIAFAGEAIEAFPPHRRSQIGLGYVPQGGQGFPNLTVAESLRFSATGASSRAKKTVDEVVSLFPKLAPLMDRLCSALSGGERQMLAIARAVIRSPRLLLLDELSEGVQPSVVEELAERLSELHAREGLSILIVDQELAFVASLVDRAHVMQKGQLIREVLPRDLADPDVLGSFGAA